ncbi:hypothetical protein G7047_21475 [Diaphorobacter sp. HDW4A]|uniref:hypothetical protein n=1 Tax=Diaphorobacter sp. HDW4A TaxID=2714924 RepID=UPI00140ABAD0|nr:hypothetical protein [Diaphorobacter sp. HDW4A]QIL82214.1 hypothetical protein G7047_21475 [Diaphorobacter sp. HDW4A]
MPTAKPVGMGAFEGLQQGGESVELQQRLLENPQADTLEGFSEIPKGFTFSLSVL